MLFSTDPILFIQEQEKRVLKYYSSNREKLQGFGGRHHFADWYLHELYIHENKCHYCNTDILDIRRLINAGIIGGRKVSGGGLRGPNVEVDRKDPFGIYNNANCVLSCYYCNNDKSNTFDYETYLNIIGPSKHQALLRLLERVR